MCYWARTRKSANRSARRSHVDERRKLPCQHLRLNRHAGKGYVFPPNLKRGSYLPRELQNRVVTSALRRSWTSQQEKAAWRFAWLYVRYMYEMPLRQSTIWLFAVEIDRFFFQGLLTKPGRYQMRLKVGLQAAKDDNGEELYGLAECGPWLPNYVPIIRLNTIVHWRYQNLHQILQTLVHEMCHLFLGEYGCWGVNCKRDVHNTTGMTGHGPVWIGLATAMYKTIQQWHPNLSRFYSRNQRHSLIWVEHEREMVKYMNAFVDNSPPKPYQEEPNNKQLIYVQRGKVRMRGELARAARESWQDSDAEDSEDEDAMMWRYYTHLRGERGRGYGKTLWI